MCFLSFRQLHVCHLLKHYINNILVRAICHGYYPTGGAIFVCYKRVCGMMKLLLRRFAIHTKMKNRILLGCRFLMSCGSDLTCLRVMCCQFIKNESFKTIATSCPNLTGEYTNTDGSHGLKNW